MYPKTQQKGDVGIPRLLFSNSIKVRVSTVNVDESAMALGGCNTLNSENVRAELTPVRRGVAWHTD